MRSTRCAPSSTRSTPGRWPRTHKAAILAALAITDELFEARKGQDDTALRLRAMTGELARLLPPTKRQSVGGEVVR